MTEKDKASPRQRQIMEQRWAKAREECPAGTCVASSRFHVAGCERRNNRAVTLTPEQKVTVTVLETGETSEATIVHTDMHAVKDILAQHDKKAALLEPIEDILMREARSNIDKKILTQDEMDEPDEMARVPEEMHFSREYWSRFEKGHPAERYSYGGVAEQMPAEEQERRFSSPTTYMPPEPAPARPWWKFWGRRG